LQSVLDNNCFSRMNFSVIYHYRWLTIFIMVSCHINACTFGGSLHIRIYCMSVGMLYL